MTCQIIAFRKELTTIITINGHSIKLSLFYYILLDIFFIYISNAIPKVPYTLLPTLLPNPPTPTSWLWHSPVLGHMVFARPRASPSIDGRLNHRLLHMQLETHFWGYWLVHIVVSPIGLQTPLAPWLLSLTPSFRGPVFHPIDD